MSDDGPTSSDLTKIIHDALRRALPWHQRLRLWLSHLKSRAATMGGYWGGVIMAYARRAGQAATAFLRRKP